MAAREGGEWAHPYVPKDLKLPGYVPCFLSQKDIVVPYLGTSLLLVSFIWIFSGRSKVTKTDRLLMCWWAFTGLTHIILEGYFAFSPEFYKKKTPHYLAEVWKEYSKGDSRYVGRDAGIVTVEGITAVLEGPSQPYCSTLGKKLFGKKLVSGLRFMFGNWYAIATRKPYSYILQFAVCLGQLYGCLVYFITAFLEGDNFATSPFYYWVYYNGANGWWVVIPLLIANRSWKKITAAIQAEKKIKTG